MTNALKAEIHKSSASLLVAILGMNLLCTQKTYYKGLKRHISSIFLSFYMLSKYRLFQPYKHG